VDALCYRLPEPRAVGADEYGLALGFDNMGAGALLLPRQ
jgi:hypothetical protein